MRVLLTGAAGFLGAHVLRELLDQTDAQVIAPVTFAHIGTPERIAWAVGDGPGRWDRLTIVRADLACPISDYTAEVFGNPDIILNLASDTHPPRSVQRPVEVTLNNIGITLHLLEYARHIPRLANFVQVSTDSVYGPAVDGAPPHVEWSPIVPNNPYAASKASQEAMAIAWWRSYGVPVTIVSTMNPIGETQDLEKFIPATIRRVLAGYTVPIHANADGQPGARTYLDAGDFARAITYWPMEEQPARFGPGVTRPDRYNVCGVTEIDNLAVAECIAAALRRELKVELSAVDRPEHGHRYSLDPSAMIKRGWTPQDDIRAVIQRVARWTERHPLWAGLGRP